MAPPPGPYSGRSTLALVARASFFSFGVVYGSIKFKILKYAFLWFFVELFHENYCLHCDDLYHTLSSWNTDYRTMKKHIVHKFIDVYIAGSCSCISPKFLYMHLKAQANSRRKAEAKGHH